MDPEDIDDIYFDVADKLGISVEDAEKNPFYERVNTVKDLVLFLDKQPRLKDTHPAG